MQVRKVIIDCDPGIDDAAAIILALNLPELEVIGVTTAAGNAPLETTTDNALKVLELCNASEIPVYYGNPSPLQRTLDDKEEFLLYGEDTLGDIHLPEPSKKAMEGASDFILEMLEKTEKLSIISIGPMTNLALAAKKNPEIFQKADGIYSMGGGVLTGNVSAVAEFNYWADPEAADIVYQSGVKIHMLGLNVTESLLWKAEYQELVREGTKAAAALGKMLDIALDYEEKHIGHRETALHDIAPVVACVRPELFEWVDCHVDISTTELTRGECLADLVDAWGQKKNCCLAVRTEANQLMEFFIRTVLPGADVIKGY